MLGKNIEGDINVKGSVSINGVEVISRAGSIPVTTPVSTTDLTATGNTAIGNNVSDTLTITATTTFADAANIVFNATTGSKIGTATSQKLAFHNATPVIQYATTGTTTGFTAGSGTATKDDSTFTGNTGSTAYTIGDIVKCLKLKGLMAA